MSEFNVIDTNGVEQRINAKRMTSEGRYLWFHDVTAAGWSAVGRIDRARVARVSQSVSGAGGRTHWLPQAIPHENDSLAG